MSDIAAVGVATPAPSMHTDEAPIVLRLAVRRPHNLEVYMVWDFSRKRWLVINRTSLDFVSLPARPGHRGMLDEYMLLFDEEGFGVVGDEEWQASLDDLFASETFEDGSGDMIIARTDAEGFEYTERLDALQAMFQYKKVTMSLDILNTKAEFQAARFDRPRSDGCRYAWDLISVYKTSGILSQKGQAWKWINSNVPRWQRLADGGFGVLLRGSQIGPPSPNVDTSRTIARTSASTQLLLSLLSRMLNPTKQSGGLCDSQSQPSLRLLLDVIVRFVAKGGFSTIVFEDEEAVVHPFPGPIVGENPFTLTLQPGGMLEVSDYAPDAEGRLQWLRSLGLLAGMVGCVDVLVRLADARSKVHSFFRQLTSRLAARFEQLLEDSRADSTIRVEDDEDGPIRHNDVVLDQRLLKHVIASKQASSRHPLFLSIGVDKSRVGSVGLQTAVGVLPNNEAFILPPCVGASAWWAGGGTWGEEEVEEVRPADCRHRPPGG